MYIVKKRACISQFTSYFFLFFTRKSSCRLTTHIVKLLYDIYDSRRKKNSVFNFAFVREETFTKSTAYSCISTLTSMLFSCARISLSLLRFYCDMLCGGRLMLFTLKFWMFLIVVHTYRHKFEYFCYSCAICLNTYSAQRRMWKRRESSLF